MKFVRPVDIDYYETYEKKAVRLKLVPEDLYFDILEDHRIELGCENLFNLFRMYKDIKATKQFQDELSIEIMNKIRLLPTKDGVMKKIRMPDVGYGLSLDISGEKIVEIKAIVHNDDLFAEWFLSKFYLRKAINILLDDADELELRYLLYNEAIK